MPPINAESHLFSEWELSAVIESDRYSRTYRAEKKDADGTSEYAAIKHYSISEADLIKQFKDRSRLKQYCGQLREQIVNGLKIQEKFADEIHVVKCFEYGVREKSDCIGFDIYARFELLNSLQELIRANGLTEKSVGYIAADISGAIKTLSLAHVVHGDIRPSNIYCTDDGVYKLGNFAIASEQQIGSDVIRPRGAYLYMAPEVYRKEPADASSDIYSLGMMIYRFLNGNCIPFTVPGPKSITEKSMKEAFLRRMEGETPPPPLFAEEGISEILRRVCDADRNLRCRDAGELQESFLDGFSIRTVYECRQGMQDDTILPFAEIQSKPKRSDATEDIKATQEDVKDSERKKSIKAPEAGGKDISFTGTDEKSDAPEKDDSKRSKANRTSTSRPAKKQRPDLKKKAPQIYDRKRNRQDNRTLDKRKAAALISCSVLCIIGFTAFLKVSADGNTGINQERVMSSVNEALSVEPEDINEEGYSITYVMNGGTALSTYPAAYTSESEDIYLDTPERQGYEFTGWYTSQDLSDISKVSGAAVSKGSQGDKIFYAGWKEVAAVESVQTEPQQTQSSSPAKTSQNPDTANKKTNSSTSSKKSTSNSTGKASASSGSSRQTSGKNNSAASQQPAKNNEANQSQEVKKPNISIVEIAPAEE